MICYAFPPVGGAGVQRSVKFVKYLSAYGWYPIVLTVKNPSVPVQDTDLIEDIPPETTVLRSRTWEPGYRFKKQLLTPGTSEPSRWKPWLRNIASSWLQPDPQILWNHSAWRAGLAESRVTRFDAIYVSGPPFSSFLLGARFKQRLGLPLILDFRDEWSLSARYLENQPRGGRLYQRQMRLFESVIRDADGLLATTQASAAELRRCVDAIGATATVQCIYNGYDPDDFVPLTRARTPSDRFRMVYTGTLWRLTNIEPLVRAMLELTSSHPGLASKLELQIVGRRTADQDEYLRKLESTSIRMEITDYLPHLQSLKKGADSDALVLLLSDLPGAERVVPGKLFEYLALNRPMLAIVPVGETRQLLDRHHVSSFAASDIEGIRSWLVRSIESKTAGRWTETQGNAQQLSEPIDLEWCNRIHLTEQLATLLDRILQRRQPK